MQVRNLSIIIPCLNSASTICETLLSLEPLRARGARVCLVDSGSTDGTVEYARGYVDEIFYEAPGNMYAAINTGIRAAETDWVTYLNSDDIIHSDAVIGALDRFSECADLIYGNIDYVDATGRFIYCWRSVGERWLPRAFRVGFSAIPQPGTLFRKETWRELGGFDTAFRYSSDSDFFLRAFLNGYCFRKLSEPQIASFRVHSQQLSHRFAREMERERKGSWAKNRLKVNCFTRWIWVWQFRLSNWDHLLLRCLRYKRVIRENSG